VVSGGVVVKVCRMMWIPLTQKGPFHGAVEWNPVHCRILFLRNSDVIILEFVIGFRRLILAHVI